MSKKNPCAIRLHWIFSKNRNEYVLYIEISSLLHTFICWWSTMIHIIRYFKKSLIFLSKNVNNEFQISFYQFPNQFERRFCLNFFVFLSKQYNIYITHELSYLWNSEFVVGSREQLTFFENNDTIQGPLYHRTPDKKWLMI